MNKKAEGGAMVIILILLIGIGIWGYIGGQEAQKVGVTCDMGLEDFFCWKWHTNTIGETQEFLGDLFGG